MKTVLNRDDYDDFLYYNTIKSQKKLLHATTIAYVSPNKMTVSLLQLNFQFEE